MNQPFDSSYSAALLQWEGAISTAEKMPRHNPNRTRAEDLQPALNNVCKPPRNRQGLPQILGKLLGSHSRS